MVDGSKEEEKSGKGTPIVNETVEKPSGKDASPNEDDSNAAAHEILRDLVVLPPRQQDDSKSTNGSSLPKNVRDAAIALPPIRAEEPVQSIKAALSEVVGLAQITNYRLELEDPEAAVSGPRPQYEAQLVSPYVGPHAVVSMPIATKALDENSDAPAAAKKVLDEWSDLSPLLKVGLRNGSAFRMVLQRYDAAAVKDHLLRLRSLFNCNAPAVLALLDEETPVKDDPAAEDNDPAEGAKYLPSLAEYDDSIDSKNLKNFFYLACGEDPRFYDGSKLKKKKKSKRNGSPVPEDEAAAVEAEMRESMPRWNELDELCRVNCDVGWSGFHPPPPTRSWMGDLAYLQFTMAGAPAIHITATRMGFYVNKCSTAPGKPPLFDPSPAAQNYFAHSLLDCLLQASPPLKTTWSKALSAAKERAELLQKLNQTPAYLSLFRVAVRTDMQGLTTPAAVAAAAQSFDATLHTPSWLVPRPSQKLTNGKSGSTGWTRDALHAYLPLRAEEELTSSFGVDLRTGGIRDWNEELQLAREMPTSTQIERLERARLLYKIMMEFGEASLLGVKAIADGHVTPMNPNESMRTQVYLHNNIFFSRAVDAGPETFKMAKGDRAAKKSANRDLQCNSTFHRMEKIGLSTLATVLIDYLGTRFVCQSILPGILIGERAHKLLIGAVESGVPLKWDEELHKILEEKLGEPMQVATRKVLRNPLTPERIEEINRIKKESPPIPGLVTTIEEAPPDPEASKPDAVMTTCIPIEAKGILGSDQRRYLLDFGRLAPRDANWVPKELGGTGKWESENGSKNTAIPNDLDDDEWTMCVLRPELVTRFTQVGMSKYLRAKRAKELEAKKDTEAAGKKEGDSEDQKGVAGDPKKNAEASSESTDKGTAKADSDDDKEKKDDVKAAEVEQKLSDVDIEYLKSLRLNVNVFLPDVRTFEGVDEEMAEQWKRDEERVREASVFLWDEILPKITKAIKDGHQPMPNDGRTLTEFIHRNGVNCRYLGRLAVLAQEQEMRDLKVDDDIKNIRPGSFIERRSLPKCWLELLECEMVARAAKHVLDGYLMEHAGAAATQPAQTVASFLSALISESEESAAQTETRVAKGADPDDDDFSALTIVGVGGGGDAVLPTIRSRYEVWQDIEAEVGRRFRYTLSLFNNNKPSRSLHLPLLRRVCQRTGVRIIAKNYDLGGRSLCSGGNSVGGRLIGSYPVSPLDIIDIVPLMKHAAAHSEGFHPCSLYPSIGLPPLQVSLIDARTALERAHIQTNQRLLNRGLELAQEALTLYQRVTETAAHPAVIETMELMASIFLEGGDLGLAATHAEKALGLAIQSGGFDAATVVTQHLSLFQVLYTSRRLDRAVKHLRAAIFLLETMGGSNHTEVFSSYHKLGSAYSHTDYDNRYLASALKCFQEAETRDSCDRLMAGITSKNFAKVQAGLGAYKDAVESEKKAFRTLRLFLGVEHQWTKDSDDELKKYTKLAVEKGSKAIVSEKRKDDEAKAAAMAADLVAQEAEEARSKAKKNKKKKGKK